MNTSGHRQERLPDQIRTAVAEMISLDLKDPRIGFVTVTRVDLAPDFHSARVWISVLGNDEEKQQTIEGLASSAGYLRREIGHRIRLRRVPEFTFMLDHGADDALRIEALIAKLNRQG